ncbi:hypothetical protein EYF80_009363 [Liparis tanakae]|uniref:Uncharacterized protein n=1 Tax=Liparis tanakae TaxID=230148 RepID=A0A4Z2IQU5_9TELE|nr:hypothetical protein EYF80_009363 [Liparis tanakae]
MPGPSSKKLPRANFCLMDSLSFFWACDRRTTGRNNPARYSATQICVRVQPSGEAVNPVTQQLSRSRPRRKSEAAGPLSIVHMSCPHETRAALGESRVTPEVESSQ